MADMPPGKVKPIQEMLNKIIKPQPALKVDGILGKNTAAALKQFQSKAGLKQTGEVDTETAPAVARAIKTGKIEKDQPTVFVDIGGGKMAGFTDKEWEQQKKRAAENLLRGPVREAKMKAAEAQSAFEHFTELKKDQYIVSFLIETTRWTKLPPKGQIDKAVKAADELEKLAKSQDFDGFSRKAPQAAIDINDALDAMRSYREDMIDGGGNWVTGLEVTKWASFTVLSIYAAPVAAASLGTGAVASAVIGGAAVKGLESAAGEVGNWSAGNAKGQDPGGMVSRVLIDTLVGAVIGWMSKGGGGGKSVAEAISTKLTAGIGAKLVAAGLKKETVDYVVKYLISEGGKKALEGAIGDAAKAVKGDPKMTIEAFATNVAKNFAVGAILGPFLKWVTDKQAMKGNPFDGATTKKLREAVEKQVIKEAGGTISVDTLKKEGDKLIEKYMADVVKKSLGKTITDVIPAVISKVKDLLNERELEKEFQAQIATPQLLNECRDYLVEEIKKDLKKRKK